MLVFLGFAIGVSVITALVMWNTHLSVENDRLRGWFSDAVAENTDLNVKNQRLLDHVTQLATEHRDRDAKGRYTKRA